MARRILVIDDDKDLSYMIKLMLERNDFQVTTVNGSEEAYQILAKEQFDLLLLDINLGTATGFEICEELRKVSSVPIIFASARTDVNDKITSLNIGGDDYLEKPYSLKELLAHINALIRRSYGFEKSVEQYSFGDFIVNVSQQKITRRNIDISLSTKEFQVLSYLLRHYDRVVTKEELLANIWSAFSEVEPSTVTVHIRWIREKLEDDPANPIYIKTVWGKGYRIEGVNE